MIDTLLMTHYFNYPFHSVFAGITPNLYQFRRYNEWYKMHSIAVKKSRVGHKTWKSPFLRYRRSEFIDKGICKWQSLLLAWKEVGFKTFYRKWKFKISHVWNSPRWQLWVSSIKALIEYHNNLNKFAANLCS